MRIKKAPIVFDGSVLAMGPITGVGRAFLTTLRAYLPVSDRTCIIALADDAPPPWPGLDVMRIRGGPIGRRVALARGLRNVGAALLHSPVAALPLRAPCPMLATVHDLPWLLRPRLGESGCRWRHRLAVRLAVRRAAAIIVPSRATRDDLLRSFGERRAGAIRVIPHGVDAPPAAATSAAIDGPFVVLGDDRPRKNLDNVRAAHALARTQDADLPPLRLIGPRHGYIDEPQKWQALRGARALLHLSLLEGFGLPVVEAFAAGTPVLCSAAGSLHEVAGDAALYADPRDIGTMAAAMLRLHRDEALRADLRRKGLARAPLFRPENTAAAWLALHRELAP